MTTLTLAYSSITKKANSFNFLRINWKAYCFGAFLISLCLAIFYVLQINYMIGNTYLIKDYQKQINSLSQENKILEVDFAKTSFMETIGEKTQEMSFEKVKNVKYVQILEGSAFLPKNNN
ncbi:MAG: hypothetical protein Q7S77_02920 [Candidatus Staskawiczbacteria bacterium]|nr:hypothetical protein [Candidatus Staskawiczbacteria bacterium]